MIKIGKINSIFIEDDRRKGKYFVLSKADVNTGFVVQPYGEDSAPIKDSDTAIGYTTNSRTVILGTINKNQKSEPGEKRIFATDDQGVESVDIFLRNDGTIEIGGTGDNLVKFTGLDSGLSDMVTGLNAELTKIQTAITTLGGAYAKVDVAIDIDDSKAEKLITE